MVIVNLGERGFFLETEKEHKSDDFRSYDKVNKRFPGKPQSFPKAIDLTHPYKNFKQVTYEDRHENDKRELVSIVDLTARISSSSQNILLVFDVVHELSPAYYNKKRKNPDY